MEKFDIQSQPSTLEAGSKKYEYYSLAQANAQRGEEVDRLPYSLKILLENLLRQHAEGIATSDDIANVIDWLKARTSSNEVGFRPARVMMVDSSGIPCLGDMAAMRDALHKLGGDPQKINPSIPVDFIVDHSVIVDYSGTPEALSRNVALEFQRNQERYAFLKWGAKAFNNMRLFPPGTGICHQINLEFLARVVWSKEENGQTQVYPDSVLGMDSHTPMVNSLGVLGWGVGGLEGGTAAMGEPVSMLIPEVVGCVLTGRPKPGITATDIVLTIVEALRKHDLVGKFIEYVGQGVHHLSALDRATIANMTPEIGATVGFFPVDSETIRFLRQTGRSAEQVELVEAYCKAQGLWRECEDPLPEYTSIIEIDLSSISASIAGPRHPQQRISIQDAPAAFSGWLASLNDRKPTNGVQGSVKDGDLIIAAITSCTNTANPYVMVAAGLLARNAVERGLRVPAHVKTSLSPGSRVVSDYLEKSGLMRSLEQLGFNLAGFGCMTCIGNSGGIDETIARDIKQHDIAAVAVLSGNRNFEGRVHPSARANFLASPPLVVAYALAGSIRKNLVTEPLGADKDGKPVYLRDIWPGQSEIQEIVDASLVPSAFSSRYLDVSRGTPEWASINAADGALFAWPRSTFVRRPPFFDQLAASPEPTENIVGARALAIFGDMLTTDHISPIGAISPGTSAANYMQSIGIAQKDFVNFGARRLNHSIMVRGTFANIRIRNEMTPNVEGGYTRHMPDGEQMFIFDAAEKYRTENIPVVVVGGKDYGAGSSRDWAAKGTRLLGVRAVIAESFERIHRSNLVGIGVVPLQFMPGETRKTLELDGAEVFDIDGLDGDILPKSRAGCVITYADGRKKRISLLIRLDTSREVEYFKHGGILNIAIRERL
ncbi:aconitate hydratase AcnA [Pusillimonas sp. SM2304]|uniref:aconitate hydratase AcnA n=1 Tax=Pusillimonas sp. SM2304 TaxID=3073241 RepID=UPI002876EE98|nr:aconitate hydratase AcnA [Pusillimonas sp. SM2304]MDS1139590.1 aconitate hydratase AcnA [Pusillimonas sp. SM2304]